MLPAINVIFTFDVAAAHAPNLGNGALDAGLSIATPLLHFVESSHETERSDRKSVLSFKKRTKYFNVKRQKYFAQCFVELSHTATKQVCFTFVVA